MYQITNSMTRFKPSATMASYKTIRGAKIAASKFYMPHIDIYVFCELDSSLVASRINGTWTNH